MLGGTGVKTGADTEAMRVMLHRHGFEDPRDYTVAPMGSVRERTQAILAKTIWGVMQMEPYTYALAFIIAGLRLGVGRAIIGVVVAEFFGTRAGLGYLILTSSQLFDTSALFVAVVILAGVGVLSVVGLQKLERWLAPWREYAVRT